ncbi:MAG: XamI family restriction endonuclease [Candidatus Poribacteria bacterium]|nr:XamI family restriction endonuclease [Candidatus Poribacteria bacterium]
MGVNKNKPDRWKTDIAQSVDFYNDWFLRSAPQVFKETRLKTSTQVEQVLKLTANFTRLNSEVLQEYPTILPVLRMATCPPIARDRLIGLAGVPRNLVKSMEDNERVPPLMKPLQLQENLKQIEKVIRNLLDSDIFVWLDRGDEGKIEEIRRAATIIADRLCGAEANPILRNAQEKRQLMSIQRWLQERGYMFDERVGSRKFDELSPGTFVFHLNVPVRRATTNREIKMPIDVVIMPLKAQLSDFPLLIEAKSAGDFTNTNKRRKEEATKVSQLRSTYGDSIRFILFLSGYFDSNYLEYEADEGID